MSTTDPAVLQAVEAAVENAPDDRALRFHLAQLLFDAGRPDDALPHCTHLLQDVPDDPRATTRSSRTTAACMTSSSVS